ncbi:uncharacterized protein CANTADRAFT_7654 [Suhomyces tanzawaensis NRRL Y-17324]|uniref:Zn(2)-C6 fungal-type domain-containing protein n=1 Tax=Suhomyces tanzawaensis NRRL Y-17324 TaxID=984487 RepID=A0A1E4SF93_9ASCO|nr:uncharacterized protein CANTADRAFT_7654 [Suhomyces tanzawaensis NRRL Y-17324]ODV78204.1 hypothetical protein CANTADRAFT_7654 [Suhomyces tanzawaensis NRRL Y-17324]
MNHQHLHQPVNSYPGPGPNGSRQDAKAPKNDQFNPHPEDDKSNEHIFHNSIHAHNFSGPALNEFEHHSPQNYLDSNWEPNMLMDNNGEMLYNVDLPQQGHLQSSNNHPNSIMQSIQYQNNIHQDAGVPTNEHKIGAFNGDTQAHPDMMGNPPQNEAPEGPGDKSASSMSPLSMNTKATKHRRPCDHCRRRKTKCVIIPNTNNCVQCEAKSLTCTYTSQAVKRKAIETDFDASRKKSDNDPRSMEGYNPNLALLQGDQSGIVPPNVPIRDVQPVQDYSSMNNSLLKKTLSLQFPRSSFYVGPTSYLYDINLLNMILDSQKKPGSTPNTGRSTPTSGGGGKIEQVNLNDNVSLRKVSDKVQFILKDDQSPHSYQSMSNDVDTIEKFIAPHGQILIDLYFRIIHPSYPILHKKVFLEKYSRTHREFSAPLLAAVYVLAIQWWDYDPQLNRFPKPNVELILKIGLNNYLLEILKRPKLSAVQAGLLLLQCKNVIHSSPNASAPITGNDKKLISNINLSVGDSDYSDWVLCSQVVSLAEELGLGLDCNNWKLPKWERGLRKRLAWAVYMEDKWLSVKNSRPSHIHENNWVVLSLAEEDFPEKHGDGDLKEGSSDIDNGKKIFQNYIRLSMILSEILDQFYSMKAMQEITEVNQVLKLAKPLQLKLRNWYHSLPVELQMSSVQPRKLCSNGYLQLAYFATELSLHRKISTVIYQQTLAGNPPPPELVNVCRTAAKTRLIGSIEFVRDLKPEHIHSFWHSSAASNFTLIGTFAAILFMSAPNREEADFYRDQIFNYRWILKMSSKGFDQVAEALSQLDLVLNHIPGLFNDNAELPMVVPNVPTVDLNNTPSKPANEKANQTASPGHRPSISSQQSFANGQTHKNRVRALHGRANSQAGGEDSPYGSPQSYGVPGGASPNTQQTISRGGNFVVNSPQSSQGLSPKDIIKQQRLVNAETFNKRSPSSLQNVPVLSRGESNGSEE